MSSASIQPLTLEPLTRGVASRPRRLHDPRLLAYAAIALAVLVRVRHVLSAGFPLNDGGLFLRMTQEIQAAGYRLPAFTSYNNSSIPFAYSPLGFYITGAVNSVTGIPLLQLFRFIPLFFAILTVIAFYHLARTVLRDERTAAAAVLAFGLLPRSFVWMLMGGGVTRSIAFFFAVVALQQAYQMYTRREWRYAAGTAIACTLTVLSHLSTANFLAFSIVLVFVFYGRNRFGLLSSAAVVATTMLLTAPWWGSVVAQHGFAPFQAARSSSGSIFSSALDRYEAITNLARFNSEMGGEALFPLIGVLSVVGALASLRPGLLLLPVWWVLISVLDVRAGMSYASIPGALLAGIAVTQVLVPGLSALYRPRSRPSHGRVEPLLRSVPAVVFGLLLAYGVARSLSRNTDLGGETASLSALTPADLAAMRWAEQNTLPSSRFLVVSGTGWYVDKTAEWFPALTNRTSISTVQGSEWLPGFTRRTRINDAMQSRCRSSGTGCLDRWSTALGQPFSYVYVRKSPDDPCCASLIQAIRRDPAYAPVYDGAGAFIAERRPRTAGPAGPPTSARPR